MTRLFLFLAFGVTARAQNPTNCTELMMRGEGECDWEENLAGSCPEGSACRNTMAMAIEQCNDSFYEEKHCDDNGSRCDVERINIGSEAMLAQRKLDSMCSECGRAFWELGTTMMSAFGEGGGNPNMCSHITQMGANVKSVCTDSDMYFDDCDDDHDDDDDDECMPGWKSIRNETMTAMRMLPMLCSECGQAFQAMSMLGSAMEESGTDMELSDICDSSSSMGNAIQRMKDTCNESDTFSNGTHDMPVMEMMRPMVEMCDNTCTMGFMQWLSECTEENGQGERPLKPEACEEDSRCGQQAMGVVMGCWTHGTPPTDEGEGCMSDENSCLCHVEQDPTFCEDDSKMQEVADAGCGTYCVDEWNNTACTDDPTGFPCAIKQNPMMCGCAMSDTSSCTELSTEWQMKCGNQATLMGFGFMLGFGCMGMEQPGGNCVEVRSDHPVWQSDIWNSYTPRRCTEF